MNLFTRFFSTIEMPPGAIPELPLSFVSDGHADVAFIADEHGCIKKIVCQQSRVYVPLRKESHPEKEAKELIYVAAQESVGIEAEDDSRLESLIRTSHRRTFSNGVNSLRRGSVKALIADKRIQNVGVSLFDYFIYRVDFSELGFYEAYHWNEDEAVVFAIDKTAIHSFVRLADDFGRQGIAILDPQAVTRHRVYL